MSVSAGGQHPDGVRERAEYWRLQEEGEQGRQEVGKRKYTDGFPDVCHQVTEEYAGRINESYREH